MREPVEIQRGKALMSVLAQVLAQSEPARIGVAAYIEGAGLEGGYRLELTGVRLVPIEELA